jgi:site-specific DNA recombinase
MENLHRIGVKVISCQEDIDMSTPTGVFTVTLLSGIAQLERDNIIEKTRDGWLERVRKDGDSGGAVPYGYVRVQKSVEIDPFEAGIVKYIFELRDDGYGYGRIADQLNRVKIKPRKSRHWKKSSIQYIVKNKDKYNGGARNGSSWHWPKILN